MKKQFLGLCLFLSICNISIAQTKRENILNEKVGTISLSYTKITDVEKSNVDYLIYLGFQNAKYQTITDIKSIAFMDTTNFNKFKTDLLNAYKILEKGEKVEMSWDNLFYKLNLYDFSKSIYIFEPKGTGGYTILTKRQLGKLLENLSVIDYGKDQLLPESTIDDLSKK
jgi:hypothetical protein